MKRGKVGEIGEALDRIRDGCTLMYGGFGGVGTPPTLVDGILAKGVQDLVLIGNDAGFPDIGIGRLVSAGRVQHLITSHIGSNPVAGKLMNEGKMKVEFSPPRHVSGEDPRRRHGFGRDFNGCGNRNDG